MSEGLYLPSVYSDITLSNGKVVWQACPIQLSLHRPGVAVHHHTPPAIYMKLTLFTLDFSWPERV